MPCYAIAAAMLVEIACACTGGPATPGAGSGTPAQHPSTIQDLMHARIDPAADVLWDSVAFIASEQGEEDRRPRSAADWDAVRQAALSLIEAAGELAAPGRPVAALDAAAGPGEIKAADIRRRIDADRAGFAQRAGALGAAARRALAAIDAKNAEALMNAGGSIDAACESCHVLYWYPQQAQPHQ